MSIDASLMNSRSLANQRETDVQESGWLSQVQADVANYWKELQNQRGRKSLLLAKEDAKDLLLALEETTNTWTVHEERLAVGYVQSVAQRAEALKALQASGKHVWSADFALTEYGPTYLSGAWSNWGNDDQINKLLVNSCEAAGWNSPTTELILDAATHYAKARGAERQIDSLLEPRRNALESTLRAQARELGCPACCLTLQISHDDSNRHKSAGDGIIRISADLLAHATEPEKRRRLLLECSQQLSNLVEQRQIVWSVAHDSQLTSELRGRRHGHQSDLRTALIVELATDYQLLNGLSQKYAEKIGVRCTPELRQFVLESLSNWDPEQEWTRRDKARSTEVAAAMTKHHQELTARTEGLDRLRMLHSIANRPFDAKQNADKLLQALTFDLTPWTTSGLLEEGAKKILDVRVLPPELRLYITHLDQQADFALEPDAGIIRQAYKQFYPAVKAKLAQEKEQLDRQLESLFDHRSSRLNSKVFAVAEQEIAEDRKNSTTHSKHSTNHGDGHMSAFRETDTKGRQLSLAADYTAAASHAFLAEIQAPEVASAVQQFNPSGARVELITNYPPAIKKELEAFEEAVNQSPLNATQRTELLNAISTKLQSADPKMTPELAETLQRFSTNPKLLKLVPELHRILTSSAASSIDLPLKSVLELAAHSPKSFIQLCDALSSKFATSFSDSRDQIRTEQLRKIVTEYMSLPETARKDFDEFGRRRSATLSAEPFARLSNLCEQLETQGKAKSEEYTIAHKELNTHRSIINDAREHFNRQVDLESKNQANLPQRIQSGGDRLESLMQACANELMKEKLPQLKGKTPAEAGFAILRSTRTAMDLAGCDFILYNKFTGEYLLLDATARDKSKLPRLRADGVITLDRKDYEHSPNGFAEMKVDMKAAIVNQLAKFKRDGSPFNIATAPLDLNLKMSGDTWSWKSTFENIKQLPDLKQRSVELAIHLETFQAVSRGLHEYCSGLERASEAAHTQAAEIRKAARENDKLTIEEKRNELDRADRIRETAKQLLEYAKSIRSEGALNYVAHRISEITQYQDSLQTQQAKLKSPQTVAGNLPKLNDSERKLLDRIKENMAAPAVADSLVGSNGQINQAKVHTQLKKAAEQLESDAQTSAAERETIDKLREGFRKGDQAVVEKVLRYLSPAKQSDSAGPSNSKALPDSISQAISTAQTPEELAKSLVEVQKSEVIYQSLLELKVEPARAKEVESKLTSPDEVTRKKAWEELAKQGKAGELESRMKGKPGGAGAWALLAAPLAPLVFGTPNPETTGKLGSVPWKR